MLVCQQKVLHREVAKRDLLTVFPNSSHFPFNSKEINKHLIQPFSFCSETLLFFFQPQLHLPVLHIFQAEKPNSDRKASDFHT